MLPDHARSGSFVIGAEETLMPFHNNICQLVQKAIAAYLTAEALSFEPSIYTSILDESAANPNVLVKCAKSRCLNTQEGNWKAQAEIEFRENKDDTTADDHHEHAGEVFASFATATIAADLSAALDNFTAFQVIRVDQSWRVDGRLWVSCLTLELDVCGSDIA